MAYATSKTIPFVSVLQATGHGEVWDHTDAKKFTQFGWRCTNRESSYSPTQTLIGNWNEQRFDISTLSQAKTIPSQVNTCTILCVCCSCCLGRLQSCDLASKDLCKD